MRGKENEGEGEKEGRKGEKCTENENINIKDVRFMRI